jgi:serine/threonine-protein kinase
VPPAPEPPRPEARRCPVCSQIFSREARFCPVDGDPLVEAPDWDPEADPLLGQTIDNRYKVLRVLGEGASGRVYKVQHVALNRLFALKVLRRDVARDEDMMARFIREAQAAAAIGHPNIISVSDFGSIAADGPGEGEHPYFVMEYLTGSSLASMLRKEGALSPARAGPLFREAASALAAAHASGVIHRDLKPANIFVARSGDRELVKILDFGVATIGAAGKLTEVGMVTGTPHYMCPERVKGGAVDQRADIYALGVIMYQCFAGRAPFEADTYAEVLEKHVSEAPEPIEAASPDARALGGFGPVVMRCLAKDPKDRFETSAELVAALEAALAPMQIAGARKRGGKKGKAAFSPETMAVVRGALITVVILAAVGLGVWLWLKSRGHSVDGAGRNDAVETAPLAPAPPPGAVAAAAPGAELSLSLSRTGTPPSGRSQTKPSDLVDPWGGK